MYPFFLSIRFIRRHLLMTLIGSFFVGASLVVLIVVMSVMDGFQAKLKETFIGSSADVRVTPRFDADLEGLDKALRARLGDRVVASGPHYQTISLCRREGFVDPSLSDEFQVAQVYGIDGRREPRVNRFGEYLHTRPTDIAPAAPTVQDLTAPFRVHDADEAADGRIGVIVGRGLARELHIGVGQRVKLFSLVARASSATGSAGESLEDYELRQELFLVVGIYESGNSDIDRHSVFMDHEDFVGFFDARTAKKSVRMKLANPDLDIVEVADVIRAGWWELVTESLPDGREPPAWLDPATGTASYAFRAEPWFAEHATMVRAIESEKAMILVIAFLIVIAGTSSIFAAQWLLVSDKVREIGILRALGATVSGITTIFVLNGFLMGVLGSIGGTAAGLLAVREIDGIHGIIKRVTGRDVFDADIYLFKKIPTQVNPEQITQFAIAALVCTLIAAAIPALRAGFMDPARALHHE